MIINPNSNNINIKTMKKMKIFRTLFLSSLLMSVLALVSCGGASLKAIDEKIAKDGIEAKFSSGEYDAMISFIEKQVNDNSQYDPTDDAQMEQFGDDFGRMFSYILALGVAKDNGDLSSSQIKKLEKIQQSDVLNSI